MRNANIKEEQQLLFFQTVEHKTRNETLDYCLDLINSALKPNHTLKNNMKNMTKAQLLIAMNNFIMKGHGYGM